MVVHENDASDSSQPSWGKSWEVGYSTSLSMVCVKYSAYVRRIVADFLHVPPNEYSPRPNDKSIVFGVNLLKIEMLVWGKLIQKLCQKGVYEESFSRHAAWIGRKLIQLMHTTIVPVQVKTLKIQDGEHYTFYNGLTLRYRDTINAAAGGTFMKRRPEECYDLIKNMTAYHNEWDTSAQRGESSSSITSCSPEISALSQQTYGGSHSYVECQAASGYNQDVYATMGNYNAR
nr:hypothetical protein [Tanacetum cinerariifolium]